MSIEITENLEQALNLPEMTPTLIMKVNGWFTIFNNIAILSYIRIGDPGLVIGNDWRIGGYKVLEDQHPYITFTSGKTTSKITQTLDVSRGQGTSISTMNVALVDKNQEMTKFISPGFEITEILGRDVEIYSGVKESSWPEDYNVIFRGVVRSVQAPSGVVVLSLSSSEERKRASILSPNLSTELTAQMQYRSEVIQSLLFQNTADNTNVMTVEFDNAGTAGAETCSLVGGTHVIVHIDDGVTTASNIRKAVENSADVNTLITAKIAEGFDGDDLQYIQASTPLGIDTQAEVLDASQFIAPNADTDLETFALINEELVQYLSKDNTTLYSLTRGSMGTPALQDVEANLSQVLRLHGNPMTLALKLMISKGPAYYSTGLQISSIVYFSALESSPGTIYFSSIGDIDQQEGISEGDLVTIEGDTNPANNVVDAVVIEVGKISTGSYVVVDAPLVSSPTTSATMKVKSQFNTLPIGLGMHPKEVDVKQHIFVRDTFLPSRELDLYTDDISNVKDFLDKEIYLPNSSYSVPRKGRASVAYVSGPLPFYTVQTLDINTVKNPANLQVERSTTENFFNTVLYNYNYSPVTKQYNRFYKDASSASLSRIPVGEKVFQIDSKGLRDTSDGLAAMVQAAKKYLRRFEFGAEFIKGVQILFKTGYRIEIGDVVAVDFASLKLSDFYTGDRNGGIKLFEVQNKIIDNYTGEVTVNLVNTIYERSDRYGLISPESLTDTGCTTSKLLLQKSFGTQPFQKESRKWQGATGQQVLVHNEDWSKQYLTYIRGFDNNTPQGMAIDPIAEAPGKGWSVCVAPYPQSTDVKENSYWKNKYAFLSPRVACVTSGSATTLRFEVAPADIGRFFEGAIVQVHNADYSQASPELTVTNISGNLVNVSGSIGFIPTASHSVDYIGFKDKQPAYRYI